MDEAQYDKKGDGPYTTIADFKERELPNTCTVTLYKIVGSLRCPFTHTVAFREFSSGQQKWATMPFQMIAKVAESFSLRKAFGGEFDGIHEESEIDAIQDNTLQVQQQQKPKPSPTQSQWENLKKRIESMDCEELISNAQGHWTLSDSQILQIRSWYENT
jgi:transcription initiation factor TFIID subunit TAF12